MTFSPTNRARLVAILRPPKRLRISEWAEEHAWIPPEGNAEPGKYRLSRMPHQSAMLDDLQDPRVREVFWQMASQAAGKTACLTIICEYAICYLHKSLNVVRATKETALEWLREKFLPTVRSTPAMDGMLKDPRARDSESVSLSRKFPGGRLRIIGAKSPAAFRGGSAGIVLQDEIDSYETTKEGDPCALGDRATITFSDAWKLKCSTTTLKDFSRINAGLKSGDWQKYFLPCPVCGGFQDLKFEQIKFSFTAEEDTLTGDPKQHAWTLGAFAIVKPEKAIYVCEHCHHAWTDLDRIQSYMSGHKDNPPIVVNGKELRAEWRATQPFNGIRSRDLNGFYLTMGLEKDYANFIHQFAAQFLKAAAGGRETLMAWTNMVKNEPFEDASEKVSWADIKKRAEDYEPDKEIPAQVVWVTWAADVHPDRVEILFYGWGDESQCWCLTHKVIYGDFDLPEMQDRVWDFLSHQKFNHPVLGQLAWSAGAMDCGHQTKVKSVYRFTSKHRLSNVFSIKGFEELSGATFQVTPVRGFTARRINANVDHYKTTMFDRLRNPTPGPNYIHFPVERNGKYGEVFYNQLCSEKRIAEKQRNGGYVHRWVKHTSNTRNEVLDMTVYSFALSDVCQQEGWISRKWKEVQAKLREMNPAAPVDNKEVIIALAVGKLPELKTERRRFPVRRKIRIASPFGRF